MLISNNSNKTFFFLILYLSLLISFYLGEDSTGGAINDFKMRMTLIENFKSDFLNTLLNYDKTQDRHSPLILIIITLLYNLGLEIDFIRLIHLNILPLLIFFSYKCIKLKFPETNNNILFLISTVFFISPVMRSLAIWPDSRILGLLFFIISVFFFLKFKKNKKFNNCLYSNIFLIISSYFSPNFSVFFIFFFYNYLTFYKVSKKLFLIITLNFFLALPMLYYLFILDVNFIYNTWAIHNSEIVRFNYANKILIISSLIFFYSIPFIINNVFIKFFLKNFKKDYVLKSLFVFIFLTFFFNYSFDYTGGGIFFKISYLLFNNKYLFLLIAFISIIFIRLTFKLNLNNIILFFVLIISNPQLTIYHKYYDTLLLLLYLLLFNFNFDIKKILNKKFLINIYIFYLIFWGLNLLRYYF